LDDPVTSLDHNYRDRVAAVLAQEGLARQIIVFTHDIAFLARLESYARDRGTPLAVMTVLRGSSKGNHGQVDSDAPWERRGVKARLRTLETQLAEARRLEADQNAYDREAISIYERLRETWERAVEETLLNGAVTRFEEAVHTQRLQGVDADNFETDLGDVMTEMSSCSAYLHDTPPTLRKRPPGPQVIGADIDKLRQWKKRIDKRRQ